MRDAIRQDSSLDEPAPPMMPARSRYAGQPVDVSTRRSVELVGLDDGCLVIDPNHERVVVEGFYHAGEFWRAVIPLDHIEDVFGLAFNFSKVKTREVDGNREVLLDRFGHPKRTISMLNHLLCRFKLKEGRSVWLFPTGGETEGTPHHEINDFVYSLEAVGPVGVRFNVRDGLAGHLICAHRFLSTEEMVFERIVVENQFVIQSAPIPFDESQKRAALSESLTRSHCAKTSERYYMLRLCGTNNCTSNPFQILDKIVDYNLCQRLGSFLYRLPISPRLYLRLRGMDADPMSRKLLKDEFEAYVSDAATQRRKREYVRARTRAIRAAREAAAKKTPPSLT